MCFDRCKVMLFESRDEVTRSGGGIKSEIFAYSSFEGRSWSIVGFKREWVRDIDSIRHISSVSTHTGPEYS
jgi:hypothetical protein